MAALGSSFDDGTLDGDIAALEVVAVDEDDDVMMGGMHGSDEGGDDAMYDEDGDGDDEMLAALKAEEQDQNGADALAFGGYTVSDTSSSVSSPCGAGEGSRAKQQEMEISPTRWKATTTSTTAAKTKKKPSKKSATTSTAEPREADGVTTTTKPQPKPRVRKAAASTLDDEKQKELKMATMAKRKQAAIDQRRKRNREAMQRARQRDKVSWVDCMDLFEMNRCLTDCARPYALQDYMDGLRDMARDLERKHNALLATVNEQIAVISTSGRVNDRVTELQHKLQVARDQAEALKRQNLHFLDEIGDRIKREDRMEGLLRELMREQQAQEQMLNEIFRESLSESQMGVFFTEERAMREILRSRNDRRQVERQGFDKGVVTGDLFGWNTKYRYEGKLFFFSFTKTFRNRSAAHVMETNWGNELKMVTYRNSVEAATQRWHVRDYLNATSVCAARLLILMCVCVLYGNYRRRCKRSTTTRT